MKWFQDSTYTLEAAAVLGALISLVIKVVLFWGLIRLVHSFGQGLRERSEYTAVFLPLNVVLVVYLFLETLVFSTALTLSMFMLAKKRKNTKML